MIKYIINFNFLFTDLSSRVIYPIFIMPFIKQLFASCGKKVIIGKGGSFTFKNVYIGNKVFIVYYEGLLLKP